MAFRPQTRRRSSASTANLLGLALGSDYHGRGYPRRACVGLNILAAAASRVRHFEEKRVRTEMVFPSLLSAFAEMHFQDREGGTLIGKCANCGEPFTTDRGRTSYCSPKCATKARQRRFIEKNPDYYRRGAKLKT